jgi:hypothetical protein
MKNHFKILFDQQHSLRTMSLSALAIAFISGAAIIGIADNLPGLVLLLTGIVLLYFSILHPWKKPEFYAILIASCVFILILEWLAIRFFVMLKWEKYLSEAILMVIAFFICLPGILVGIIGVMLCVFLKKKN